jgi:hypothetical protein
MANERIRLVSHTGSVMRGRRALVRTAGGLWLPYKTRDPSPDPDVGGLLLTWPPPTLVSPITINVSGDCGLSTGTYSRADAGLSANTTNTTNIISVGSGVDAIVVFSGVCNRRVVIVGGRHIRVIGGEFNIDLPWIRTDLASNNIERYQDRGCLYFKNQSGIIHVEGVRFRGDYVNENVKAFSDLNGSPVPQMFQIQNCRADATYGTNTSATGTGYHSDFFQPVSGFTVETRVDLCTISTQFQAFMAKGDWGRYLKLTLKRTNIRGNNNLDGTGTQEGLLLNYVEGTNSGFAAGWGDGFPWFEGPITHDNVWVQTHSSRSGGAFISSLGRLNSHWTQGTDEVGTYALYTLDTSKVSGKVYAGTPPTGDFCPAGVAGMSYSSPGYGS